MTHIYCLPILALSITETSLSVNPAVIRTPIGGQFQTDDVTSAFGDRGA